MNVVSLLTNGMVQIHELATQKLIQEFPASAYAAMPDDFIANKLGTLIPSIQRRQKLQMVDFTLPNLKSEEETPATVPSRTHGKSRKPTFTRSRILLQCNNAVHALTSRSRISQAEALIDLHRLRECKVYLERRPMSVSSAPDPDEVAIQFVDIVDITKWMQAEELHYLQLRLGFKYFMSTEFEEAGTWLFRGQLDPQILISFYPDLADSLLDAQTTYKMFSSLIEHIPRASVEDVSEYSFL